MKGDIGLLLFLHILAPHHQYDNNRLQLKDLQDTDTYFRRSILGELRESQSQVGRQK